MATFKHNQEGRVVHDNDMRRTYNAMHSVNSTALFTISLAVKSHIGQISTTSDLHITDHTFYIKKAKRKSCNREACLFYAAYSHASHVFASSRHNCQTQYEELKENRRSMNDTTSSLGCPPFMLRTCEDDAVIFSDKGSVSFVIFSPRCAIFGLIGNTLLS